MRNAFLVVLGIIAACSGRSNAPSDTGGGKSGSGGETNAGRGGTAGTATGGSATGGTASGGTNATGGTGGDDSNGGTGAADGGQPSGGDSGSGGAADGGVAGVSGAGPGGAGVGGAGSGGVSSGAAGAGGGGKGGSGGAILDLIGALDGYFMQHPCCGNPQTDDCGICGYVYQGALVQCVNGSSLAEHDFPIGGTPGATYQVTMHFYGILSPKNYGTEVTREAAPSRPGNMNGGAMPPPWAYCATPGCTIPISTYDTREIHVFDHMDREIGTYFLNADSSEVHITYVLNFEKTIPVVGGGRIRMRMFDSNCRIIKNCGSTAGYPCAVKARTVDISAAYPLPPSGNPPAGFSQPGLGEGADHGGLWFLLDVIAVSGPM